MITGSARNLCGTAILAVVLASSCAVNQKIVIKCDGSGTLAMHVEVAGLLHEYLARLSEVSDRPVAASNIATCPSPQLA